MNITDNKGRVSKYTYDKLDRLTSIDYVLTSDVNYTYDEYDITPPTWNNNINKTLTAL